MTIENPAPIWSPSTERIAGSQLQGFFNFCSHKLGGQTFPFSLHDPHPLNHYEALHRWSIEHPEAFWDAIRTYYDLRGNWSGEVLREGHQMPGARWYPDAQLNFAENLLKHDDTRIALIERGEDGRNRRVSYGELKHDVGRLASFFRLQGVSKGDRIAAFLPNSRFAVIGMLAAASIGAIWSSCSPDFGFQGVLDRFEQIQPTILIACDGYTYGGKLINTLDRAEEIASKLDKLKAVVIAPYLFESANEGDLSLSSDLWTTPAITWKQALEAQPDSALDFTPMAFSDPLYILYSSGTTGKPKCIVHSIGGTLIQHVKELGLHTDVTADTTLFYYTTCGWMMWNWLVSGLALGAAIVLYDGSPFHPVKSILFDIADEEGIEVFGASAKYYSACEKFGLRPRESHSLTQLKTLLSTGSPLSHESFDYLYREVKNDVCVSSISGGTDIVSCFALGNPALPVYKGELQCLGLGMAVEFYDEEGQTLEHGKGELVCTRPFPSMPVGFWNDAQGERYHDAYFASFTNVWAHGDYGESITHTATDGKLSHRGIIIHGRSDAVLNPGGVRIGTAEIYRQVEKVPEVFESIAVGQQWQDDVRVILFVRMQDRVNLSEQLIDTIKQTIRQNTTPRHVPAKIIQVKDIPRTLSGKLVELAVRKVIHGEEVKNKDALANPEALDLFNNLAALRS